MKTIERARYGLMIEYKAWERCQNAASRQRPCPAAPGFQYELQQSVRATDSSRTF